MRKCWFVLVGCLIAAGCACHHRDPATRPTASDAVAAKPARTDEPMNVHEERKIQMTAADHEIQKRNEETKTSLNRSLEKLHFSGEPLSNAFESLRNKTNLNIFVNWRAMEAAGVKQTLPVTCTLHALTAEQGLHKLLDEVGSERVGIDFTIDDGVVTVSTREDLAKNTATRVYDVRTEITSKDPVERGKQVARIVRVVHGISPLSWRENGGTIGSVRELGGQLIVTATPETHKRVAEELAQYRAQKDFPLLSTRRD